MCNLLCNYNLKLTPRIEVVTRGFKFVVCNLPKMASLEIWKNISKNFLNPNFELVTILHKSHIPDVLKKSLITLFLIKWTLTSRLYWVIFTLVELNRRVSGHQISSFNQYRYDTIIAHSINFCFLRKLRLCQTYTFAKVMVGTLYLV